MGMQTTRTAVVVTRDPEPDTLDALMNSPDIDVVIFELPARAYSRIRQEQPAVVIVSLTFESMSEFQLLTALKLDRETASIPVWTCADLRDAGPLEQIDFGQAGATCSSSNCFQRS